MSIDPALIRELEKELQTDEGTGPMRGGNHLVYDDATGKALKKGDTIIGNPTIGYGRELSMHGIAPAEAVGMLESDIDDALEDCQKRYDWFAGLDPARQLVVASVSFNMGVLHFAEFHQTHAALAAHDWQTAAAQLLDSKAARDLPPRYARYAQILRTGTAPQFPT